MTLDIEGTLAAHYTYTAGRGLTVRCKCGEVVGERGGRASIGNSATHRAHVAAVLREQIAAAEARGAERALREAAEEVEADPFDVRWRGISPAVVEECRKHAASLVRAAAARGGA